jgi:prepilin-type processing-associated H-X9-DG protein
MFLLKYFSKTQYTAATGRRLADFKNTPLWGCPAVDKSQIDAGTSSEAFDSGYGMSPYGLWTERTSRSTNSGAGIATMWPKISISPALAGKYLKQSQYTHSAERGIIADSRSWLLEIIDFTYPAIPPQNISTVGYVAGGDQFDRYRHGKWKKIQSFNVLYCDGHVANLKDIRQGWIAMRRNVPPAVAP